MAELSTLARPYAKAVFELAQAGNSLAEWATHLQNLQAVTAQPVVQAALQAPGVSSQALGAAVLDALPGLPAALQNLVRVLAENRRLGLVAAMVEQYADLKRAADSQAAVVITTAQPVADVEQGKLAAAVAKRLNRSVDIAWNVDEALIAGARIQAGDLVIDGSAQGELARMQIALAR